MSTPEPTPRTPDTDAPAGEAARSVSPRGRAPRDAQSQQNVRASSFVGAGPAEAAKTSKARRRQTPPAGAERDANRAALSRDGVPLARVRRSPRVIPFLVTGAVLGAIVGLVIATRGGEGGNYTDSSSTGYLLVLFGALGALLGGVAFAIADRRA